MTPPTTPRDDIGLSERLRRRAAVTEYCTGDPLCDEAATQLDALQERVKDCEEVLADKRRLAREIDIAMHGEEGAAKQASLCDLVEPARRLRARVKELEAERSRALDMLGDIPGETLYERLNRFIGYYLGLQVEFEKRSESATRAEQENEVLQDKSQSSVIVSNWFDLGRELNVPEGGSVFDTVIDLRERAIRAEQERDEAYERAAKVAENFDHADTWPGCDSDHDLSNVARVIGGETCDDIAAAIRRLASGPDKEKRE